MFVVFIRSSRRGGWGGVGFLLRNWGKLVRVLERVAFVDFRCVVGGKVFGMVGVYVVRLLSLGSCLWYKLWVAGSLLICGS